MQNRSRKLCKTSNYVSLNTFCVCARMCVHVHTFVYSCMYASVCTHVRMGLWRPKDDSGAIPAQTLATSFSKTGPLTGMASSIRGRPASRWDRLASAFTAPGLQVCTTVLCCSPAFKYRFITDMADMIIIVSVFILSIHLRNRQTHQRTCWGRGHNHGLSAWALFFLKVSTFKPVRSGWKFSLKYW